MVARLYTAVIDYRGRIQALESQISNMVLRIESSQIYVSELEANLNKPRDIRMSSPSEGIELFQHFGAECDLMKYRLH